MLPSDKWTFGFEDGPLSLDIRHYSGNDIDFSVRIELTDADMKALLESIKMLHTLDIQEAFASIEHDYAMTDEALAALQRVRDMSELEDFIDKVQPVDFTASAYYWMIF